MNKQEETLVNGLILKEVKKQQDLYFEAMQELRDIIKNDSIVKESNKIKNKKLKHVKIVVTKKYIYVKSSVRNSQGKYFNYATFSRGNKKLVGDDNTSWLIFNTMQRITCSGKTSACIKFCYANKTNNSCVLKEKFRGSRLSRIKNTIFTMFSNFDDIVNQILSILNEKTNKKIIMRYHEAGDIYSVSYQNKIINTMKQNPNIEFMLYTKTYTMLNEINKLNKLKNVAIRYSLDVTTNTLIKNKCKKINCLTFEAGIKSDNLKLAKMSPVYSCNIKHDKELIKNSEDAIAKFEGNKNKTNENKMNASYNKFINTEVQCNKCMKCRNKNIINLNVGIH